VKREYKIQIEREGRWWMVHIPELDGLTQARHLSEAELMAREWIAVSTGTPISDISLTSLVSPSPGSVLKSPREPVESKPPGAQLSKPTRRRSARLPITRGP
jgi:predicted RNase H-like HicB family nuclease